MTVPPPPLPPPPVVGGVVVPVEGVVVVPVEGVVVVPVEGVVVVPGRGRGRRPGRRGGRGRRRALLGLLLRHLERRQRRGGAHLRRDGGVPDVDLLGGRGRRGLGGGGGRVVATAGGGDAERGAEGDDGDAGDDEELSGMHGSYLPSRAPPLSTGGWVNLVTPSAPRRGASNGRACTPRPRVRRAAARAAAACAGSPPRCAGIRPCSYLTLQTPPSSTPPSRRSGVRPARR